MKLQRLLILVIVLILINAMTLAQANVSKVFSMDWNPSGTILAVGGIFQNQRAIRLLDNNGQLIQQINNPGGLSGISWSPDGTYFTTTGSYYTFWDASTGTSLFDFTQRGASNDDRVYWNPSNSEQIATVERDLVLIRDARTGAIQTILDGVGGRPDSNYGIGWSFDGSKIYTVSTDAVIRIWNTTNAIMIDEASLNYSPTAFSMSPDSMKLAIAGADNAIHIHDSTHYGELMTFNELPVGISRSSIQYLLWSPDASFLAGVDNRNLFVWDVETGELVNSINREAESWTSTSISYTPNGTLTYPNTNGVPLLAPVANAGINQTLDNIDSNDSELVTLDASLSTDNDGTIVSYEWYKDGTILATGINPQIMLGAGVHNIILTVTDDDGATAGDIVNITVNSLISPTVTPISTN